MLTLDDIKNDIEAYVEDNFRAEIEQASNSDKVNPKGLYWKLYQSNTQKLAKEAPKFERNMDTGDITESIDRLFRAIDRLAKYGSRWIIIAFSTTKTDANPSFFVFQNPSYSQPTIGSTGGTPNDNLLVNIMQQNFSNQLVMMQKNFELQLERERERAENDAKFQELKDTIAGLESKPEPKSFIGKALETIEKNKTLQGIVAGVIAKIAGVDLKGILGLEGEEDTDDDDEIKEENLSPIEKLDHQIIKVFGEDESNKAINVLLNFMKSNPKGAREIIKQLTNLEQHGNGK